MLKPHLEEVKAAVLRVKEFSEKKPELEILSDEGKEILVKVFNTLN